MKDKTEYDPFEEWEKEIKETACRILENQEGRIKSLEDKTLTEFEHHTPEHHNRRDCE